MTVIAGTVLGSRIVPTDTADIYETHDPQYGLGGLRTVATTTIRNAITTPRLQEGMLVYVTATGITYQLEPGYSTPTIDADWSVVIPSAGAITGTGAAGQVTFWTGTTTQSGDNAFGWDNVNKRFVIGSLTASNAKVEIQNGSATVHGLWLEGGGNTYSAVLRVKTTSNSSNPVIEFQDSSPGQARTGTFNYLNSAGTAVGQIGYVFGSNYMVFQTNSAEAMRIDSTQNLEINFTGTSLGKLHIVSSSSYGAVYIDGSSINRVPLYVIGGGASLSAVFQLETVSNSSNPVIIMKDSSAGQARDAAINYTNSSTTVGQINYNFGSNYMTFMTNANERVRITSGGLVGVNTTNPAQRLQVNGAGGFTGTIASSNANGAYIYDDGTHGYLEAYSSSGGARSLRISGEPISFRVDVAGTYTEAGRFTTDAYFYAVNRVGIANASPSYMLHVTDNTSGVAVQGYFENSNSAGRSQILVSTETFPANFLSMIVCGSTYSTGPNYPSGITGSTSDAGKHIVSCQGASSVEMLVGTVHGKPLSFYTNSATRMVITSAGLIGINELSPDTFCRLHITDTTNTTTLIKIENATNGANTALGLLLSGTSDSYIATNATAVGGVSANALYLFNSGAGVDIRANGASGVTNIYGPSDALYVRVTAAGLVGINVAAPATTLEVRGTVNGYLSIFSKVQSTDDSGGFVSLKGGTSGTTDRAFIGFGHTGSGSDTVFTGEAADSFSLRAQGKMHLGAGGNNIAMTISTTSVCIGAQDPNYQLEISRDSLASTLGVSCFGGSAGNIPSIYLGRGEGTRASSTVVTAGDALGALLFAGVATNGAAPSRVSAYILAQATETWTSMTSASDLGFYTTVSGDVSATQWLTLKSTGSLGLRCTDPNYQFEVSRDSAACTVGISAFGGSAGTVPAIFLGRGEGSRSSTTAVTSGVGLGIIIFTGVRNNGDAIHTDGSGAIISEATENWSSTAMGSKMYFQTVANTTTSRVTALTIEQDSTVTINVGPLDLSPISAGSSNLKITKTTDTPSTVWTAGVPSNNPSGYIEITEGGTSKYIPFWT